MMGDPTALAQGDNLLSIQEMPGDVAGKLPLAATKLPQPCSHVSLELSVFY